MFLVWFPSPLIRSSARSKVSFLSPLCAASQQVASWARVLTSERACLQVFVVPPVTQGWQLPNQVVVSPFEPILGEFPLV